jgi:chorismate mutase
MSNVDNTRIEWARTQLVNLVIARETLARERARLDQQHGELSARITEVYTRLRADIGADQLRSVFAEAINQSRAVRDILEG